MITKVRKYKREKDQVQVRNNGENTSSKNQRTKRKKEGESRKQLEEGSEQRRHILLINTT